MSLIDILLIVVIAAALIFAARRCVRLKKSGGCGCGCSNCDGCPKNDN